MSVDFELDNGKRKLHIDQGSTTNYKLRFLKPVIKPSMFKLSLPITLDELPNWTPFLDLVVLDGRNNPFRCFWLPVQNGKIALTCGWQEFYQTYKINLDSMIYFKHKGNSIFQVQIFDFGGIENSYQLRDPEEPPYVRTGDYQIAKCISIPPLASAKAVAAKPNVPHLSHFTEQKQHIHGSVGIFEVISTKPVTIIQVRCR
ncbi:B3 DNA binding domain-containing protein [Arachis hypogaea]|nr:B3 DNA binding domain-containing protein [Arachis hypogaea]